MPTAAATFLVLFCILASACGGNATSDELELNLAPRDPNRMGYLTVTGTVRSATVIPKGAQATLGITVGRPAGLGVFDEMVQAAAPADTSSVSWQVKRLASGDAFSFFVGVDLNGDGAIGVGDLGGYYDGSTVLPFHDPGNARLISVRRDQTGLDFGIGLIK